MRTLTKTIAALAVAASTMLAQPANADTDFKQAPTVGVIGDSNTWGYGSTRPYGDMAGVAHHGVPGACTTHERCGNWCTFDPTQDGRCGTDLWMRDALRGMGSPDTLVILMGSNDLFGGATAAQVKRGLRDLRTQAYRLGVEHVAFGTIPPVSTAVTSEALEHHRAKVNAWIEKGDHVDYAAALDNSAHLLQTRYDAGDGIHFNNAGHRAMAKALTKWVDAI